MQATIINFQLKFDHLHSHIKLAKIELLHMHSTCYNFSFEQLLFMVLPPLPGDLNWGQDIGSWFLQ